MQKGLSITISFGIKLIFFVTFLKTIEIRIFSVYDVISKYLLYIFILFHCPTKIIQIYFSSGQLQITRHPLQGVFVFYNANVFCLTRFCVNFGGKLSNFRWAKAHKPTTKSLILEVYV